VPAQEFGQVELAAALRRIPGWLEVGEAWALHQAARQHPAQRTAIDVVEIGSWHGRSTIALATGLRERGGGVVHAIDPHVGTSLHEGTGVGDTWTSFHANVRAAGLEPYVHAVPARSVDARPAFADASVDVLFVDGSHEYEDVLRDIDDWSSALRDGAIVAFHDIEGYPGVTRALEERVLGENSPFHRRRVVDRTLLAEFRRGLM
jgi:predicted O-methyltransferase YrrM